MIGWLRGAARPALIGLVAFLLALLAWTAYEDHVALRRMLPYVHWHKDLPVPTGAK